MPVSVHGHHGLMDTYHVGLFIDKFQELLNDKYKQAHTANKWYSVCGFGFADFQFSSSRRFVACKKDQPISGRYMNNNSIVHL